MNSFAESTAKRALDMLCVICGGPFVLGIAAYTRYRIKKDSPGDAIYAGKRLGKMACSSHATNFVACTPMGMKF